VAKASETSEEGHAHIFANMSKDVTMDHPKVGSDEGSLEDEMGERIQVESLFWVRVRVRVIASSRRLQHECMIKNVEICEDACMGTHEPDNGAILVPVALPGQFFLGKEDPRGRLRDDGKACDSSEGRPSEDLVGGLFPPVVRLLGPFCGPF
jgi:hypothetical protein